MEEEIGRLLRKLNWTLALAESCTGGYFSHRITRVPGCSDYFITSVVTYSDAAKKILLGVQSSTLERYGAVSRETAFEMARGVKVKVGSSVAVSTTGVAGPAGGSPETPVGTVWIAVDHPGGCQVRCFHFKGDRITIIKSASETGLHWLRDVLLCAGE